MEQPVITFIMNGKSYRLSPNDTDAIRQIPRQDREQLVVLLESIKLQDRLSASAVQQTAARAGVASPATQNYAATNTVANNQPLKPERIGKGDVDDLMARLIMEERMTKKPGISTLTIYKWAAGIIAVIFLLVLIS